MEGRRAEQSRAELSTLGREYILGFANRTDGLSDCRAIFFTTVHAWVKINFSLTDISMDGQTGRQTQKNGQFLYPKSPPANTYGNDC